MIERSGVGMVFFLSVSTVWETLCGKNSSFILEREGFEKLVYTKNSVRRMLIPRSVRENIPCFLLWIERYTTISIATGMTMSFVPIYEKKAMTKGIRESHCAVLFFCIAR